MDRLANKYRRYRLRKKRIRGKLQGTREAPRMTVTKSLKNISVQAIDDITGTTLACASTLEKELKNSKRTVEDGKLVGQTIGKRLKAANITTVIFDRNGYLYHGIVKAVADGARQAGIEF